MDILTAIKNNRELSDKQIAKKLFKGNIKLDSLRREVNEIRNENNLPRQSDKIRYDIIRKALQENLNKQDTHIANDLLKKKEFKSYSFGTLRKRINNIRIELNIKSDRITKQELETIIKKYYKKYSDCSIRSLAMKIMLNERVNKYLKYDTVRLRVFEIKNYGKIS